MKKITRIFGFILACMILVAFQVPTNAAGKASVREVNRSQAEVQTVQGEKFTHGVNGLYYNFSNKEVTVFIKVRCSEEYDFHDYEFQLLDYTKKKVLATKYNRYDGDASFKIKRNQLYYYRIKAYDRVTDGYVPVSNWIYGGGINTGICSVKLSGKKIKIKTPKIKGVKKLTLYMSTNIKKGYKKVKTVKPGSTVTLAKFNKKAFKEDEDYFYYIISSKKQSKFLQSFYIKTARK